MKKRMIAMLLCTATAVSLLAGCGSTSEEPIAKDPESLVVAYDIKNPLDPFTYPTDLTRNVMEPLIKYQRSQEENGGITEALAESYEHSEDGLTWTFHLRDAKFSNGADLDSGDVVASLEYALGTPVGAGNYAGYHAQAIDEKTVEISVEKFSDNEAMYLSWLPIVDADTFASMGDEAYFNAMIGTGPYVLDSYEESTGLAQLEANENYWGEQPKIKNVTMRYIPDPNTALIALRGGEVDFATVPSSHYDQARGDSSLKVEFGQPNYGNYIIFNTEAEPTNNPKLRQAILYAIDTDGIATMSAVEGNYVVPHGFYQEGWGMSKPEGFTEYTYNPDKARQLLEEAGIQTPLDLGTINIMESQKSVWEVIQQNLAEVGINIQISSVESTIWLDSLWKGDFIIAALTDTDLVEGGYSGICDLFYSWSIPLGYNYSRYSDPTLDSYLTAAAEATTYEEQNENFGKALDIINNMALWGIIYTYGPIYAMNANLNAEIGANLYFTEMSWNG